MSQMQFNCTYVQYGLVTVHKCFFFIIIPLKAPAVVVMSIKIYGSIVYLFSCTALYDVTTCIKVLTSIKLTTVWRLLKYIVI